MMDFTLRVVTIQTMPLPLCMMCKLIQLHGLPIIQKREKGKTGGEGTSSGADGDTLLRILEDVKSNGFIVDQIVMDHDTSTNAIVCSQFPDTHIAYCGNHTAKTFHSDLSKIRSLKCKCKQNGLQCKRMSKTFVDRVKHSLKCLVSCSEILDSDNPLSVFSEGSTNFITIIVKVSILLSGVNIMWKSTMTVPHLAQNIHLYVLSKPKTSMSYCKTCQRGYRSM